MFAAQGDESDESCKPVTTPAPTTSAPATTTTTTTTVGTGSSGSGVDSCTMGAEQFLIENRRADLGKGDRRAQRYITVNETSHEVTVSERTESAWQLWSWLVCGSETYLVNYVTYTTLASDGQRVTASYDDVTSLKYDADTGFLRDVSTGKVARVIKRNTSIKMVSKIRYAKDSGEPWELFLWDLVNVEQMGRSAYGSGSGIPSGFGSDFGFNYGFGSSFDSGFGSDFGSGFGFKSGFGSNVDSGFGSNFGSGSGF